MIESIITGDAAVIARFDSMPQKIRDEIRQAMMREWYFVQSDVVTSKLSGDPLHRVTGVLASSINVGAAGTETTFEDSPTEIVGRVGTNVKYAAVHEYGGVVEIPSHERRLTQVFGREVSPRTILVAAHQAHFPERSYLRSTLREHEARIRASIAQAVSIATGE